MSMRKNTTTLLISTYNSHDKLRACLESIRRQTVYPSEIIVAEDGEDTLTKIVIKQYQIIIPIDLVHLTQEDKGFRKTIILNKALAIAKGDYIIQIDGDIIMDSHFVEDHLAFSRKGCFVCGGRAKFDEFATNRILKVADYRPTFLSKGLGLRMNAIRCKWLAYIFYNYPKSPVGCNMAYWRDDIIMINGYNNEYIGWGKEDYDLGQRLVKSGVESKRLKFCALAFHLYHKEVDRSRLKQNINLANDCIRNSGFIASNGLKEIQDSID